jgi:hypothetical protein
MFSLFRVAAMFLATPAFFLPWFRPFRQKKRVPSFKPGEAEGEAVKP